MYSKCNNFHFCKVLSFLLNFLSVTHPHFFSWQLVTTLFSWKQTKKKEIFPYQIEWRFFSAIRNDNLNTSLHVPLVWRDMKQSYDYPSRPHHGQPLLSICLLVFKAVISFQIQQQHHMLYLKITVSTRTKGVTEQAHQKLRIPTLVSFPFGLPSPCWLTPCGPQHIHFNPKSSSTCLFPTLPKSSLGSKST